MSAKEGLLFHCHFPLPDMMYMTSYLTGLVSVVAPITSGVIQPLFATPFVSKPYAIALDNSAGVLYLSDVGDDSIKRSKASGILEDVSINK